MSGAEAHLYPSNCVTLQIEVGGAGPIRLCHQLGGHLLVAVPVCDYPLEVLPRALQQRCGNLGAAAPDKDRARPCTHTVALVTFYTSEQGSTRRNSNLQHEIPLWGSGRPLRT